MKFKVIDKQTSKEADPYEIALYEEWASCLVYCDMEGFAITEDGDLVLMDECGNVVYCDSDRFKVIFEGEADNKETAGQWIEVEDKQYSGDGYWMCPVCDHRFSFGAFNLLNHYPYCPKCGRRMKGGDEK